MSKKSNIFITGATGYIGGTVLSHLLKHPEVANFNITALTRSNDKAEKLKAIGVKGVVGSHSDIQLLTTLSAESDIVIATADADDLGAAKAILAGLKKRHAATGVAPIYIHTSGTGVLADRATGDFATDVIYDDSNVEQIASLPDSQVHRNVDLELVHADAEGYAKIYIILPSTIWGIATGPVAEHGIQNVHSQQVPALIHGSLDRGRAGTVGQGKNIWPNVEIDEVADLYIVVFDAARKNPDSIGHGREGFYFGETAEHTLYEVGKAIGEALVALGKSDNPEPTPFTKEEIEKYFAGSSYLGTNSRCRANHSRAIGWKTKKTKADFLASIKPEIEAILKQKNKV